SHLVSQRKVSGDANTVWWRLLAENSVGRPSKRDVVLSPRRYSAGLCVISAVILHCKRKRALSTKKTSEKAARRNRVPPILILVCLWRLLQRPLSRFFSYFRSD